MLSVFVGDYEVFFVASDQPPPPKHKWVVHSCEKLQDRCSKCGTIVDHEAVQANVNNAQWNYCNGGCT